MEEKGDLVDMVEYQSLGDFSPDRDVDDLAPAL
mgnify:FL=1